MKGLLFTDPCTCSLSYMITLRFFVTFSVDPIAGSNS